VLKSPCSKSSGLRQAGQQVGRTSRRGRAPSRMEGAFPTISQRIITRIRIHRLDHSDRNEAGDPTGGLSTQDAFDTRAMAVIGVSNEENTSFNSIDARQPRLSDPRVVNTADDAPAVLTTSFNEPLDVKDDSKRPPAHSIVVFSHDIATSIADTMMVPNTNSTLQSEAIHSQSTVSSVRIMFSRRFT